MRRLDLVFIAVMIVFATALARDWPEWAWGTAGCILVVIFVWDQIAGLRDNRRPQDGPRREAVIGELALSSGVVAAVDNARLVDPIEFPVAVGPAEVRAVSTPRARGPDELHRLTIGNVRAASAPSRESGEATGSGREWEAGSDTGFWLFCDRQHMEEDDHRRRLRQWMLEASEADVPQSVQLFDAGTQAVIVYVGDRLATFRVSGDGQGTLDVEFT